MGGERKRVRGGRTAAAGKCSPSKWSDFLCADLETVPTQAPCPYSRQEHWSEAILFLQCMKVKGSRHGLTKHISWTAATRIEEEVREREIEEYIDTLKIQIWTEMQFLEALAL